MVPLLSDSFNLLLCKALLVTHVRRVDKLFDVTLYLFSEVGCLPNLFTE